MNLAKKYPKALEYFKKLDILSLLIFWYNFIIALYILLLPMVF